MRRSKQRKGDRRRKTAVALLLKIRIFPYPFLARSKMAFLKASN